MDSCQKGKCWSFGFLSLALRENVQSREVSLGSVLGQSYWPNLGNMQSNLIFFFLFVLKLVNLYHPNDNQVASFYLSPLLLWPITQKLLEVCPRLLSKFVQGFCPSLSTRLFGNTQQSDFSYTYRFLLTSYCSVNICVPDKFKCSNPHVQHDGIRR